MNGPKNQTEAALRIIKTPAMAGANEESAAVFDFIVFRFRQGANASFIPLVNTFPATVRIYTGHFFQQFFVADDQIITTSLTDVCKPSLTFP